MKLVYDSMTGRGARFAEQVGYSSLPVKDFENLEDKSGSFIIITRSFGFGQIPPAVIELLDKHGDKFVGVIAAGNKNWGDNFGAAGDKIQAQYNIPLICKFEGSGFRADIEIAQEWIKNYLGGD